MNDMDSREKVTEVNVGLIGQAFKKRPLIVLGWCFTFTIASLLYAYIQPTIHKARVTVLVVPDTASVAGIPMLRSGTGIELLAGMLKSNTNLTAVSEATRTTNERVEKLRDVSVDLRAGIIEISATNSDKDLILDIVKTSIVSLREIDERLRKSRRRQSVTLLAELIEQKRADLTEAEQKLRDYRKQAMTDGDQAQVLKIDLRTREGELASVIAALADLRSRLRGAVSDPENLSLDTAPLQDLRQTLANAELALAESRAVLGPSHPDIGRMEARVSATRESLASEIELYLVAIEDATLGLGEAQGLATLETRRVSLQAQVDALKVLVSTMPEESMQMRMLFAETDYLAKAVGELETSHSRALVEASRDPLAWEVLDPPHILDKPVNKRYPRSATAGAILGLLIGIYLAIRRLKVS